jgi:hypothetical protein
MENTALGQAFLLVRRFMPVSIIPQMLPTHSHITNSTYTLHFAESVTNKLKESIYGILSSSWKINNENGEEIRSVTPPPFSIQKAG